MIQRIGLALAVLVVAMGAVSRAQDEPTSSRLPAARLSLDVRVVPACSERAKDLPRMIGRDARARIDAANRRETDAWRKVVTREEWERYRDQRLRALRE